MVSKTMSTGADKDEGTRARLTYTIKEACVIIGISRTTLWKAIRKSRIGCYRVGRRVLFSEEHMIGFLKLHEKTNRGQPLR